MIPMALVARLLIVPLFLFSALDKVVNHRGALAQAGEAVSSRQAATVLIVAGFLVEVIASAGLLTGVADRAAALLLAGYCGVTALLWKRFWVPGDFWVAGPSRARSLFWDFFKNFALAGGLLLLVGGDGSLSIKTFLSAPLASSQPYGQPESTPARVGE